MGSDYRFGSLPFIGGDKLETKIKGEVVEGGGQMHQVFPSNG